MWIDAGVCVATCRIYGTAEFFCHDYRGKSDRGKCGVCFQRQTALWVIWAAVPTILYTRVLRNYLGLSESLAFNKYCMIVCIDWSVHIKYCSEFLFDSIVL